MSGASDETMGGVLDMHTAPRLTTRVVLKQVRLSLKFIRTPVPIKYCTENM